MNVQLYWLRLLAFVNFENSRRRLGAKRGWEKRRLRVKVVADQTLPALSVSASEQK